MIPGCLRQTKKAGRQLFLEEGGNCTTHSFKPDVHSQTSLVNQNLRLATEVLCPVSLDSVGPRQDTYPVLDALPEATMAQSHTMRKCINP